MKHSTDLVNVRIAWCRRQSALASTEPELDGWRAEEDGLRDALLNRDHTDDYRLSDPQVLERYLLGFQDGAALLCIARAERLIHAAASHKESCKPSASICR